MNRLYDNILLTDLISRMCLLIDDFIVDDYCCLITDDGTVKEYHSIEDMGFYTTGVVETDKRLYFETISGVDKIYYYAQGD